jgi:hypothetical protein
MPISSLDPKALARLLPSDLADMALERDQAARRLAKAGRSAEAAEAESESIALAALFRDRK